MMQHNRLPIVMHLKNIGLNVNPLCHFCSSSVEDISHIFFECTNAKAFWNSLTMKCINESSHPHLQFSMTHWEDTWHKIKSMQFNNAITWKSPLPLCFWGLWLTRNNNLFINKKNNVLVKQTIARATEYYNVAVQHKVRTGKKCDPYQMESIPC